MTIKSEIEYEDLTDSISEGLLLIDQTGHIRGINSRLSDLFGYSEDELKNEPIEVLVPKTFRDNHVNHRDEYLSNPSRRPMASELQLVGKRKDGSMVPVDVSLAPVERGDQMWVIASVRNISDQINRQQRLSVLTRILRHDIRNRLTVILGHARMCQDSLEDLDGKLEDFIGSNEEKVPLSDTLGELQNQPNDLIGLLADIDEFTDSKIADMEKIINAANELDSLAERAHRVDEILETSKKEADPVELEEVLETAITAIQTMHPEATLEANLGANVTIYQPKDIVRISVEELLENGIKHNDSPKPYVSIETSTPRPSIFEIRITDNGPGLSEEEQEVLSLQKEQPLMHSGGFGLWTVNWIVSKMGGKLTFEENHPQGTTAVIQGPVDPRESG